MKELFLGLCRASVIPSLAVLAAVLLRPLLKKGPSFLRCVIWAVVFARLVIPVGLIELPVSVSPFPSPAEDTVSLSASDAVSNALPEVVPGAVSTPYTDVPNVIPGTVSDTVAPNVVPNPEPTPDPDVAQSVPPTDSAAEPTVDVVEILSVVWVCGVAVMLGYLVASALLLHYRVRDAVVYDSRVRVLGQNCSPFVSGFFRPLIYLPASANRADWQYYIAHEESHIKRFDHILKPLAFLVLCVYWFNPLVWAAYLLLSKDIEYACDEKTVKNMEETDRKAYSLALLSISQGGSVAFTPPLSFGKVSVKERITRIMNGKIPVWAVCLTVVLCVAILTLMACSVGSAPSGDATNENGNADTSAASEEPVVSHDSGEPPADNAEVEALKKQLSEYGLGSTDFYMHGVYRLDGYSRFLYHVEYDYDDENSRNVLLLSEYENGSGCEIVFEADEIRSIGVNDVGAAIASDNAIWFFNADLRETEKLADLSDGQTVSGLTWYDPQGGNYGFLYLLREDAQSAVCFYDFSAGASRKLLESPSETEQIDEIQLFQTQDGDSMEPDFLLLAAGEEGGDDSDRTYYTVSSETLRYLIQNQKIGKPGSEAQIRP